eukprot:8558143-Lingulodinium_polyedra.AAC.1
MHSVGGPPSTCSAESRGLGGAEGAGAPALEAAGRVDAASSASFACTDQTCLPVCTCSSVAYLLQKRQRGQ